MKHSYLLILVLFLITSCNNNNSSTTAENMAMKDKVEDYAKFELNADISHLNENQKKMIGIFFEVADIMDELFWEQAYGDKIELLSSIEDKYSKKFAEINYGPWDRLDDNAPFIDGVGEKPKTANFYPHDLTKEEFEQFDDTTKSSWYTIIEREGSGELVSVPYNKFYKDKIELAAYKILEASKLAKDPGFKAYLELRAQAMLSNEYKASDMAWMDMKSNEIDFIVGPIESYEDRLYNSKTAFEAFILIKDMGWSERLNRFAVLLPELQKQLPVDEAYKSEVPGSNSDLGAYDAIYYAGDCNAGSKTIAINLPNNEEVRSEKGSRRLQLKNSMKAKFDKILFPISEALIVPEQRKHITFDAFFGNVMFHEVAHGLGISYVLNSDTTVAEALQDKYTVLEESKADILGLFLVEKLVEMQEIEGDLMDNYATFLAGIFRSIRFGASSSHGIANLIRFNYFKEVGAFDINSEGLYAVNDVKMKAAVESLTEIILTIQGDGDYEAAGALIEKYGKIGNELSVALEKINKENIPVDIVFEQGPEIVGIN